MELTINENKVYKLGNDVLYLPDFKKSLNPSFIRRVYTEEEKKYIQSFSEPNLRYASTFSAKEAIYKAVKQFDTSIKLPWKKIAISREKIQGKPHVDILLEGRQFDVSLSISHDGDYVWAVALVKELET